MSESTAETATTDAPTETSEAETATVDWQAEAEKWKQQARKNEERAKTNATAAKELETLRASTMSEQEKAVAEARESGRAEAFAEAAVELVDAALAREAGSRLTDDQLSILTGGLDRKAFLDADGKVDLTAVKSFVDGIAPAPQEQPQTPPHPLVDLGQGSRGTPPALNSDSLTQTLERALGIR